MSFYRSVVLAGVGFLSACASLPPDNGRAEVGALAKERGRDPGHVQSAQQLLAEMSGRPLAAADAVRMALVNNPRLKATYSELGVAAAEVYDAGRLSNPRLSAAVLFPDVAGESAQVGFGLAQNFTDLLLLSRRSSWAEAEFRHVQQTVAAGVVEIAVEAERAYYEAVGAAQLEKLRAAVADAASVSAQLAQRFFDAGNITRLQLAHEQAAAAQAALERLQATAAATETRAALNEVMGLPAGEETWQLAPRVAAPLAREDEMTELLRLANGRLDLVAARERVTTIGDTLGVTRTFRYLGELELGVETERETDGTRLTGPTLGLELPIFNQGEGRTARAAAELERAEAELRTLEIQISNGVRKGHAQVALARERAEHYRTALVPLREAVVARTQEQYNFMLVGQFDLLLAKQQEYEAYAGYLEAVRDYWVARTELSRMVGAQLPSSSQPPGDVLDAEQLTSPRSDGAPTDEKPHQHGDQP